MDTDRHFVQPTAVEQVDGPGSEYVPDDPDKEVPGIVETPDAPEQAPPPEDPEPEVEPDEDPATAGRA